MFFAKLKVLDLDSGKFPDFSGNNKDICPANDLGLKKGIKKIYKFDKLPSDDEVYSISENWRPYRSVAVRYIWEIVDQDINF